MKNEIFHFVGPLPNLGSGGWGCFSCMSLILTWFSFPGMASEAWSGWSTSGTTTTTAAPKHAEGTVAILCFQVWKKQANVCKCRHRVFCRADDAFSWKLATGLSRHLVLRPLEYPCQRLYQCFRWCESGSWVQPAGSIGLHVPLVRHGQILWSQPDPLFWWCLPHRGVGAAGERREEEEQKVCRRRAVDLWERRLLHLWSVVRPQCW